MPPSLPLNILLLGAEGVGKTSLLNAYTSDKENKEFTDSLFLTCEKELFLNHKAYHLSIQDSKGGETYYHHRLPLIQEANVILILFSLGCRTSFHEAFNTFYKEYEEGSKKAPVMFVGCKTDLIADRSHLARLRIMDESPIYRDEIQEKVSLVNATYVECSSLNRDGVDWVFESAVNSWFHSTRTNSSSPPQNSTGDSNHRRQQSRSRRMSYSRLLTISPPRISTILKVMRVFM